MHHLTPATHNPRFTKKGIVPDTQINVAKGTRSVSLRAQEFGSFGVTTHLFRSTKIYVLCIETGPRVANCLWRPCIILRNHGFSSPPRNPLYCFRLRKILFSCSRQIYGQYSCLQFGNVRFLPHPLQLINYVLSTYHSTLYRMTQNSLDTCVFKTQRPCQATFGPFCIISAS